MTQYGVCNLSVVPLRAEASDRSEILSQLLFGDSFQILEQTEKWLRVKNAFDGYEGWIDHKQLSFITEEEFTSLKSCRVLGCSVAHRVLTQSTGEILNLLAGSSIPQNSSENSFSLAGERYSFVDSTNIVNSVSFNEDIERFAKFFLHSPYLWGGRSLFGIDCSGFTQVVFKMLGIKINRDAWQQAEQGTTVDFLQEVKTGDLAFFDNSEGRITHVGIMLNEQQIIHASGRVKIDPIDDEGIYSLDLKRHTHKLRIIKRYV